MTKTKMYHFTFNLSILLFPLLFYKMTESDRKLLIVSYLSVYLEYLV